MSTPSPFLLALSDGTVRVTGELDGATAAQLGAVLERARATHSTVRLDLEQVSFADSGGFSPIMDLARTSPVRVAAVSAAVSRLLDLLGVAWRPVLDVPAWDRAASAAPAPVPAPA